MTSRENFLHLLRRNVETPFTTADMLANQIAEHRSHKPIRKWTLGEHYPSFSPKDVQRAAEWARNNLEDSTATTFAELLADSRLNEEQRLALHTGVEIIKTCEICNPPETPP